MLDTVQELNLIAANPDVRGGRPYIIGTTVTVSDVIIAKLYHEQDSDGIASWYNLTLSQVYAALTHYYVFKDEIDQQIRRQIKRATAVKEQRLGNQNSILSR